MSIYINAETRVVVQGITGTEGGFHTGEMLDYGTRIVAGVTPGKGGGRAHGLPVYDSVCEARERTGADASIIFVPAAMAADAVMEAADAGMKLVVCITEGIPVRDMTRVIPYVRARGTVLIGPNCPGIISPGKSKLGIMPNRIHRPGRIGVVSRSGTLTYEVVDQLTREGLGQSSCVGIGGDPVIGQSFTDVMKLFQEDDDTDLVIMIGEIGGNAEQEAAQYVREHCSKPVVSFIAGRTAPPGRRMGHAGAIVSGRSDTTEEKLAFLKECGITCVDSLADIGRTVKSLA
ncbi:succinate--CoA ligase subunit alpha [Mailhella massiliensis]|uniref:Succinate--CoA ligase [ADP-forming] subunit alpha n=1 Tax=Mailhella massiliensis TaxID=1903261 RepID=A0A921AXI2_9BACT|nr:succinate--CoA ligase subunit alpha [Mailhella massiliensis]HJD97705.1 succinate--CoA ligase subunit alpha [Mailhella massiliensis]